MTTSRDRSYLSEVKAMLQTCLRWITAGAITKSAPAMHISLDERPTGGETINVVLFGEQGAGKGSVINLITQEYGAEARALDPGDGGGLPFPRHELEFDEIKFVLFEAMPLNEAPVKDDDYFEVLETFYKLIKELSHAGGIHLLLFCMRAGLGAINTTARMNYRLFVDIMCQSKVPVALVFTGLEREGEMEAWWTRSKASIEGQGIKSDGYACITTIRGSDPGKYKDSQRIVRSLIKRCYLKGPPYLLDAYIWFACVGRGLRSLTDTQKKLSPRRDKVTKELMKRCGLHPHSAKRIADMMQQEHNEKKEGNHRAGGGKQKPRVMHLNHSSVEERDMGRTKPLQTGTRATALMSTGEDLVERVGAPNLRDASSNEHASRTTRPLMEDIRSRFPHDLTDYVTRSDDFAFASGSFGDVYRGTFSMKERTLQVAIKACKMYRDENLDKNIRRFRRETEVWLKLDHPNVLPLFGTIRDPRLHPKIPAMVCPWAENGTLSAYLERNELTISRRICLVNDVAQGLRYRGSAFVTTRPNYLKGTVRWMAPELIRVDDHDDDTEAKTTTQSDVYSFGGIMLQILTNRIPYYYFKRDVQVIHAISMGEKPKRPDQAVITESRWRFMERCWYPANDAKRRPTSEEIVAFTRKELAETLALES